MDKDCWFCFSNPSILKHLIFHETPNFYCALPKGGIVEDHFLLIPKDHIANQVSIYENKDLKAEYLKIKKMILEVIIGKDQQYLAFERHVSFSFAKAVHMHL